MQGPAVERDAKYASRRALCARLHRSRRSRSSGGTRAAATGAITQPYEIYFRAPSAACPRAAPCATSASTSAASRSCRSTSPTRAACKVGRRDRRDGARFPAATPGEARPARAHRACSTSTCSRTSEAAQPTGDCRRASSIPVIAGAQGQHRSVRSSDCRRSWARPPRSWRGSSGARRSQRQRGRHDAVEHRRRRRPTCRDSSRQASALAADLHRISDSTVELTTRLEPDARSHGARTERRACQRARRLGKTGTHRRGPRPVGQWQ